MGGAFSNGQDNDELVDNLVDTGYIRSKKIEQVFRAVDRGDYFLSSHRESAYKDFAWKHGNIHLSAPCIYCEVMEELALKPGLSFLNLGSGTGYLSTMAGLLLTHSGTNHGVELHEDCVRYSYDRLEEFKQRSLALDEFDFCEPVFVQGNCLSIVPNRRYDRVYCGATCPESHEALIKEFVKVGGILVMPYKDHLVRAKRIDETKWELESMLPVSFANLVVPASTDAACRLPDCNPLSLQELCRGKIRHRLRQNVWSEHTDLETSKPISSERNRPSPPHRALRQFVIPIFEESDENPAEEDEEARVHRTRLLLNVDGSPGENLRTTLQFVRAAMQPNNDRNASDEQVSADERRFSPPIARSRAYQWLEEDDELSSSTEEDTRCDTNLSNERDRRDSGRSSDRATTQPNSRNTSDECDPPADVDDVNNVNHNEADDVNDVNDSAININWPEEEWEAAEHSSSTEEDTNFSSERDRRDSDSAWEKSHSESNALDHSSDRFRSRPGPTTGLSAYSNMSESESEQEDISDRNAASRSPLHQPSTLVQRKKVSRKDKADSGIVEDACNTGNDEASFSSDSDFANGTPVKHKRSSPSTTPRVNNHNNNGGSNDNSCRQRNRLRRLDSSENPYNFSNFHYVDTNAFSSYMKEKIHQLPLPYSLKLYINYNRNL
ncbi:uncharacterized protein LOC100123024 [Nasonia vitripennis]|uniref:Protein-L-isoaspartate O-methyltransferase domain-containing protein 1 n=1 Tax=Nasonia vitripennis TaxID=7425 RepID=A0A7M7QJ23_NASVI|nr:uncharacterized protein LOC100123024 [Nasonia vitripennis]XP_008201890.1 uncharacterized protein LOC100123024 [Nasonia vitripennis]XP_031788415.1 uncharacterized protein LOC100123024 [Nasonia vitripennis]